MTIGDIFQSIFSTMSNVVIVIGTLSKQVTFIKLLTCFTSYLQVTSFGQVLSKS